jgi:tetrapyrrole methylase family protein/MazG family protein
MIHPGNAFTALYDIVVRLRSPGGCPWDREQDPLSLRECLIEETYECIEAINENNPAHIQEELGDIFMLAIMLAYIHEENGGFSVADALQTGCEKLVRRHPHVFGGKQCKDSNEVLDNWTKIKVEQEGRGPKDSILDETGAGMPPLERAWKLQKKAAKAGFDWPDAAGVMDKVREELAEVAELIPLETAGKAGAGEKIEEELGDLLFSVVNLCRYLKVEPSTALLRANGKFISRFKYMEKKMKEAGQEMKQENLDLMDRYWNEAKACVTQTLHPPTESIPSPQSGKR